MPLDKSIKKVLVIGSGPIVIGQAAEFDYAGTQACRALKSEGLSVVLVNSNPATIMTDNAMADNIYIEPLTTDTIKRIILEEKPDSLLSTLGGQTGLTLSMQLAKEGFLEKHGVKLLGANPETIDRAEDRQLFKDTMIEIGEPVVPSLVVTTVEDAVNFAGEIGYPLIIRPAFTLGGSGGGIAKDEAELRNISENGIRLSPINQILVEKSISGWKEIEFEVIRDNAGNTVTVCGMENLDPVGVHTGDSIVIAPTASLSDKEYSMLHTAAIRIVNAMGVEGGCNCQFALNPDNFDYAVIEVNPRVSRSSALASKATGYPIAKVAAKIAVGYHLDEILNAVTGKTYACFEPAIDYIVVKFPRWPFDKFVNASRTLGTQMKATGEVMAIGKTFEQALLKAVRGCEISLDFLSVPSIRAKSDEELHEMLKVCDDIRLFVVYEAIYRGFSMDEIHTATGRIDKWFLEKIANIARLEKTLKTEKLDDSLYLQAKRFGFTDAVIERLNGQKIENPLPVAFQMVDTCAGEYAATTPYFYGAHAVMDEAGPLLAARKDPKPTIVVLGSGPIRIGQGIEFDYASVHCVQSLRNLGYEVVIINNNPETVSTDFDTADRLYFEPLCPEDVKGILDIEKPVGVVVAFGGQTAIKLTQYIESIGVKILGTSADSIDAAEDRERFDALLEEACIARPQGRGVLSLEEGLKVANELGYPVLLRPSYVLGGQNMTIAFSDKDVAEFMEIILRSELRGPILIDRYLMGVEVEVDAICDGEDILIPGIMEHIERAGVHSGDSIAVYPAWNLTGSQTELLVDYTKRLAAALDIRGLVNIQYVIYQGHIYVIEVNPRSSRTIPYISKVTGVPMIDLATRAMLGEKLSTMGFGTGLYPVPPYTAVKVPVFSFEKLPDIEVQLGPEMKSTGEVLGIGKTLDEALYKGLLAAGYEMKKQGGVLLTVRNSHKLEVADIARTFAELGFDLYATGGTADVLEKARLKVTRVQKIHEADDNTLTLLQSGKISYILSTSSTGRSYYNDSTKIRTAAIERHIPCLTSIDTARALTRCLMGHYTPNSTELVDINKMRSEKLRLNFTKMHGTGNDYIFFNCFDQHVPSPESLSVSLSQRHLSIGGDGVILICPSDVADAKMVMYNLDGSEGKMCGNGIRCVGKYIYDNGIAKKDTVTIETLSGIKTLRLYAQNGEVESATVDMGKAELTPVLIPVKLDGDEIVSREVDIADGKYSITCVSMGNPHCVVFCEDPDVLDLEKIGPMFEHDPIFPEQVNTEFVHVVNPSLLQMRVWERGSGETWACGTGTCAAVVAAIKNGYCKKDTDIMVKVKGGELVIRCTDDAVFMTGQARKVFEGTVEI